MLRIYDFRRPEIARFEVRRAAVAINQRSCARTLSGRDVDSRRMTLSRQEHCPHFDRYGHASFIHMKEKNIQNLDSTLTLRILLNSKRANPESFQLEYCTSGDL